MLGIGLVTAIGESLLESVASKPEREKTRSEFRDSTREVRRGTSEDTTKRSGCAVALQKVF